MSETNYRTIQTDDFQKSKESIELMRDNLSSFYKNCQYKSEAEERKILECVDQLYTDFKNYSECQDYVNCKITYFGGISKIPNGYKDDYKKLLIENNGNGFYRKIIQNTANFFSSLTQNILDDETWQRLFNKEMHDCFFDMIINEQPFYDEPISREIKEREYCLDKIQQDYENIQKLKNKIESISNYKNLVDKNNHSDFLEVLEEWKSLNEEIMIVRTGFDNLHVFGLYNDAFKSHYCSFPLIEYYKNRKKKFNIKDKLRRVFLP